MSILTKARHWGAMSVLLLIGVLLLSAVLTLPTVVANHPNDGSDDGSEQKPKKKDSGSEQEHSVHDSSERRDRSAPLIEHDAATAGMAISDGPFADRQVVQLAMGG